MGHNARSAVIIMGSLLTLLGSTFLPWFVLVYNPSNTGLGARNFYFSAYDMLPYINDISSLKTFYGGMGLALLLGLVSLTGVGFLENQVSKLLHFGQVVTSAWAIYTNMVNKSIVANMNQSFIAKFYGITDKTYILQHSTLQWQGGLIMTAIGLVIAGIGVYIPVVELEGNPIGKVTIGIAALSMVACCCTLFYTVDLTKNGGGDNQLYTNGHHVTVNASRGWQDTRLTVTKGDIIYILYVPQSGLWTARTSVSQPSDANGLPATPPTWLNTQKGVPLPGASAQALIVKVGKSAPFVAGDGVAFLAPESGNIFLRMNQRDADLAHASGSISEQITIVHFVNLPTKTYTMTLSPTSSWVDTKINLQNHDVVHISYDFGSGTWPNSATLVAPDQRNAQLPQLSFVMAEGGEFTPPSASQGLLSRIADGSSAYCGYSAIELTPTNGGELYLRLAAPPTTPKGALKVTVTVLSFPTVSQYTFI